ncbi:glycoside hydrolase family protein [Falsiroseomonas ponticola]|uniref:hypothetical protein n=1 Tax=Falsiroseomonas ponticola TaxID=2786951 RepID=UPI001934338B|nr:hypothetical protein [Roseomonas ponticola]
MGWRRIGRVFAPPAPGADPALASHAALPVAHPLGGDLVRIFYSGRDAANRSAIGSLVLRVGEAPVLEEASPLPVLAPGGTGAFDDAGCGMGCVVPAPEGDRLYYMGWNIGGSAPWRNAIGLALGDAAAGRFERFSAGPVMDRDPVDPFSLSYPWVLRTGPDDWRMWYGTNLAWGAARSDMRHAIRAARSMDGIAWRRDAAPCIAPEGEEVAVARPSVLRDGAGFAMWFAARGEAGPYRIGRALSADGTSWRRHPGGIDAQPGGWEGGAVAYPGVFDLLGRRWLLFNGAGYGATGIGLAVWEG